MLEGLNCSLPEYDDDDDDDNDDENHLLHNVVVVVLQFAHDVPSRRADDWKFTFGL